MITTAQKDIARRALMEAYRNNDMDAAHWAIVVIRQWCKENTKLVDMAEKAGIVRRNTGFGTHVHPVPRLRNVLQR